MRIHFLHLDNPRTHVDCFGIYMSNFNLYLSIFSKKKCNYLLEIGRHVQGSYKFGRRMIAHTLAALRHLESVLPFEIGRDKCGCWVDYIRYEKLVYINKIEIGRFYAFN